MLFKIALIIYGFGTLLTVLVFAGLYEWLYKAVTWLYESGFYIEAMLFMGKENAALSLLIIYMIALFISAFILLIVSLLVRVRKKLLRHGILVLLVVATGIVTIPLLIDRNKAYQEKIIDQNLDNPNLFDRGHR